MAPFPKIDPASIRIEPVWKDQLMEEFSKPYFAQIKHFISKERNEGKIIYPPGPEIFNAFNQTPFDKVKVVILGQDPYHGMDQAMGLCFSVSKKVRVPASLKNIYKELHADTGFTIPDHGDLTSWASQGVFMLNSILTVEEGQAGSHSKIGWHLFTDAVIQKLSSNRSGLIFLLWGNYARSKKVLIDTKRHTILEAAHPSPLARNAFSGCRHFSKANTILSKQGSTPINWSLDEKPIL